MCSRIIVFGRYTTIDIDTLLLIFTITQSDSKVSHHVESMIETFDELLYMIAIPLPVFLYDCNSTPRFLFPTFLISVNA